MSMSKKDFIALADTIRDFRETEASRLMDEQSKGVLLQYLAGFCKRQNRDFMEGRWLGYISHENGPSGGKVGR